MMDYDVTPEEAEKALTKCDRKLEKLGGDSPYVRGIKDALGWVLGHYELPDCFEDDELEGKEKS